MDTQVEVEVLDGLGSLAARGLITDAQAGELADAVVSLENIVICAPDGVDTAPLLAALLSRGIASNYAVGVCSVEPARYAELRPLHRIRRTGGLQLDMVLWHFQMMAIAMVGVDSVAPAEAGHLFLTMARRGGYVAVFQTQKQDVQGELRAFAALDPRCAENPKVWVDRAVSVLVEYRISHGQGQSPTVRITRQTVGTAKFRLTRARRARTSHEWVDE
ncbi:hypothetical protein [Paraburkholderia youngii]|uniref:hypothetical protein n=1 Tax=Paraburkholderia youngii TaxID=2782701 RepID=UPI003D1DE68D